MKHIRRPQKTAMYKFEKINGKYAKIVKNTSKNFSKTKTKINEKIRENFFSLFPSENIRCLFFPFIFSVYFF